MSRNQSQQPLKKDLLDVGVGLAVGAGSTLLVRLLSGRGRVVRASVVAAAAAATTLVRRRFARSHTTTYALTREVDRNPTIGDDRV